MAQSQQEKTVRVTVSGRVQGVAYRYWTQSEAVRRQLAGVVRNRCDGSVEAIFSGVASQVDDMVVACETGPPMAIVDSLQCDLIEVPERFTGFDIGITI